MSSPTLESEFISNAGMTTCDEISDALTRLGVPYGGVIPGLIQRNGRLKIAGPAYAVQFTACSDGVQPIAVPGHFADTLPASHVIFVSGPAGPQALWGGLISLRALSLRVRAVCINGNVRDLSEQSALSALPLWSKGVSPLSPRGLAICTAVGDSAECFVHDTGNTVRTGDLLCADENGVVCVPERMQGEVLALAKAGVQSDTLCAEDVKLGESLEATFKRRRG